MNDIKVEIEKEASKAAKLSQEAVEALAARNFIVGKALMKQAIDAGRNCQNLIQLHNQATAKQ